MRKFSSVSILFSIILAGCSATYSTIIPASTNEANPNLENSPSPLANIDSLSTLEPSATITPELKITVVPTTTPTVTLPIVPSTTPWIYPTDDGYWNIVNSPNGKLLARERKSEEGPIHYLDAIEVVDEDGKILWTIPSAVGPPHFDPYPNLSIYKWSQDSRILYFYYEFMPDGGDYAFWWTGFDLQSIDVDSGVVRSVITADGFVSFAFSLDETKIAYARRQDNPAIIYIKELSTGLLRRAVVQFGTEPYWRVGDIHWSPSGNMIAFQTENENYWVQTVLLDLSTWRPKLIQEYKLYDMYFKGWSGDSRLRFLKDEDVLDYDVNTEETIAVMTPTPTP